MKVDWLGGAYTTRSKPMSAQTCINLYAEANESQTGNEGALLGTPGLELRCQLTAAEVRALRTVAGSLYAVSGSSVYRIDVNLNPSLIGDLPNSTGQVSMTDNGTQILFSHQDGWHYCTLTGPLIQVTDPDIPRNGSIVAEQDGYVLFTAGDDHFGITALNNVTAVDPLDIATAEGTPDGLQAVVCDHREVWLLCNNTTEIWSDTGNALFPFERIPGGMLETGIVAKHSVARIDDSVFWLSQDRAGNATVIRTNGYRPLRISTHAIDHALEVMDRVDDAIGFAYQQEGHSFYQLTFPDADQTWVYDCATKLWHRRAWRDSTGVLHRHRSNSYAFFNGEHLVGDHENGRIYAMELDSYSDNGDVIYRERAVHLPDAERKRVRLDRVELVAEMGVGNIANPDYVPQVALEVSHDTARFGYRRFQTLGKLGQRLARAVWRRCGIGRQTLLRFSTTAEVKISWLGVNIDGESM